MNAPLSLQAVQCKGLRKHFGEGDARVEVLRGVDFQARLGEMTFLVGPSGCGKTTLISVIAGLLDPSDGDLQVLDSRHAEMKAQERILFRRRNLGFVFQQYNLLPSLTAAENAAVPLIADGMKRNLAVKKATDLLDRLGLGHKAAAMPRVLSGGQQQRVALARALVHEPRLIICDEPTAALDHKTGESVMELLATAALAPQRAVIVVTHDNRVFHYAHTIAHMDDGVVVRSESRH
ncbi:ABC transporter ATP-binding protein [Prosthecobacter dejongeii]|uniref:Putative ABC transport system ATP-binding protein n=1 Tax=Prosthecobacter dejongeii TaxID=48465 RepID=A0A7W8DQC9_9BACT|nr:ABC transporter ATP-binding protein [Prosthecobacter dejongeii]MBB5038075.1 putative ABC transport system ATP-binding protein [Prosthecobacter dejongeii]